MGCIWNESRGGSGVELGVEVCKGVGDGNGDGLEIGKKIKLEWGWGWRWTSQEGM